MYKITHHAKCLALAVALLSIPPGFVVAHGQNGAVAPSDAPQLRCDPSLWKHVYKPQRLKILDPCITVRGTIVDATNGRQRDGVRHEEDGDTHGWLKLDAIQKNLLDDGNRSDEGGNLVFEVVCKYAVTQVDAKDACRGYKNSIVIPRPGTHVCITGSLVQDQEHAKWNEIHPVSLIEACR